MNKTRKVLWLFFFVIVFLIAYGIDQQANLFMKNIRMPFLDFVFSIVTDFGVAIFIMLIVPSIIFYNKKKNHIYVLWLSFVISFVLAFAIKLIVLRQRPTDAFNFPFTHLLDYSFPSMHSMVVFSLLPALVCLFPKQKYFWATFAVLVSFSRIYFGVHFLSDVVFGAFAGYFIGDYLVELHAKGKLWAN